MSGTDDITNNPLLILSAALAYIMRADGRIVEEEMAEFMTVFGKHVRRGDLTWEQVDQLTKDGISYSEQHDIDAFRPLLHFFVRLLRPGQGDAGMGLRWIMSLGLGRPARMPLRDCGWL